MEEGAAAETGTVEAEATEETNSEVVTTPETETKEETKVEEKVEKTEEKAEIDWKEKSRKWENQSKENLTNLKAVQEELETIKADHEKATSELEAAKREALQAKTELARFQAATKHGVPDSALKFLTGNTAEEIEESAKELVAAFGSTQTRVVRTQGQSQEAPAMTPADRLAAMWDPNN